jgi:hypothetical protein
MGVVGPHGHQGAAAAHALGVAGWTGRHDETAPSLTNPATVAGGSSAVGAAGSTTSAERLTGRRQFVLEAEAPLPGGAGQAGIDRPGGRRHG